MTAIFRITSIYASAGVRSIARNTALVIFFTHSLRDRCKFFERGHEWPGAKGRFVGISHSESF